MTSTTIIATVLASFVLALLIACYLGEES